jgi:hypothetical protein
MGWLCWFKHKKEEPKKYFQFVFVRKQVHGKFKNFVFINGKLFQKQKGFSLEGWFDQKDLRGFFNETPKPKNPKKGQADDLPKD